jgi:3-dehydroquinate dehydratase-2
MILMNKIKIINGPNLNRLGLREPEIYGSMTLIKLIEMLTHQADEHSVLLSHIQSNHEGMLIDAIHHAADEGVAYLIINPGALTHTSIALRDALLAVDIPFIEVHLSRIHAREPFRQHSYLSDIAEGVISGLGVQSYQLALTAAIERLHSTFHSNKRT